MIFQLLGGPMDGAVYELDKEARNTNRKPDGLWFDGKDEHGRNIQHQYVDDGLMQSGDDVVIGYRYDGPVVDTGFEMETRPCDSEETIEPWCNTIMEQPLALHEQQDLFTQMKKWLTANPTAQEKVLVRPEIENIYRMQATIVALHNDIAAGDTAIRQLEIGMQLGVGRQYVDVEMPVRDRPSVPDEVAKPIRDEINRIMGQHPLITKKLECANCAEVSSNPGQFLPDGRWVCTESCRKELADKQSYDDLAASGGIVDAP